MFEMKMGQGNLGLKEARKKKSSKDPNNFLDGSSSGAEDLIVVDDVDDNPPQLKIPLRQISGVSGLSASNSPGSNRRKMKKPVHVI
jgi:hypothetical protein